jgi:hypothetical protein
MSRGGGDGEDSCGLNAIGSGENAVDHAGRCYLAANRHEKEMEEKELLDQARLLMLRISWIDAPWRRGR